MRLMQRSRCLHTEGLDVSGEFAAQARTCFASLHKAIGRDAERRWIADLYH